MIIITIIIVILGCQLYIFVARTIYIIIIIIAVIIIIIVKCIVKYVIAVNYNYKYQTFFSRVEDMSLTTKKGIDNSVRDYRNWKLQHF